MLISKDTARQRSQDKFLATERSVSSLKNKLKTNLRRANSQRILKETAQNDLSKIVNKSPSRSLLTKNSEVDFICVKKWIDYSSKYGIGYLLNNDSSGVYFNDSSKMLAFNQE